MLRCRRMISHIAHPPWPWVVHPDRSVLIGR